MSIRQTDRQGRVQIPSYIRRQLQIQGGTNLEVSLDGNGIRITPHSERCSLCGESGNLLTLRIGGSVRSVCENCARKIAAEMEGEQ